jgi:hypothetical protein
LNQEMKIVSFNLFSFFLSLFFQNNQPDFHFVIFVYNYMRDRSKGKDMLGSRFFFPLRKCVCFVFLYILQDGLINLSIQI